MAGVPFILGDVTITLDERDTWAVLHALRGEGVANDPLGYDIGQLQRLRDTLATGLGIT